MKNRSAKTAALYRKWGPVRDAFIEEMEEKCAICGGWWELAVHEITSGSNRLRGFAERATWLVACSKCNCDNLCDRAEWPMERQLAVKLLVDPLGFDLAAVNAVLAPRGEVNPHQRFKMDDIAQWLMLNRT